MIRRPMPVFGGTRARRKASICSWVGPAGGGGGSGAGGVVVGTVVVVGSVVVVWAPASVDQIEPRRPTATRHETSTALFVLISTTYRGIWRRPLISSPGSSPVWRPSSNVTRPLLTVAR